MLTTVNQNGNGVVSTPEPPTTGEQTPGETFAAAVRSAAVRDATVRGNAAADAAGTGDLTVPFGIHLPAAFPLFASRPRYTVRHLLKTASVPDAPAPHVYEPPRGGLITTATSYAATPEAAFAPRLDTTALTDLTVTVTLPDGILDHPDLLASFVDLRVLVRLSVLENQSLLHGTPDGAIQGLLKLPGTRGRTAENTDLATAVTATAAEVEETGGSCDGIVAHPAAYWELVRTGALSRLQGAGITVSRTRMMPRDTLLLGDFRAALTLLLPGRSGITLHRGAGTGGADVVEATSRIGLAVHLPQHLLALTLGPS
ncbi:family 3 encapsulin nanocompartment shell protein [Krasilnikovia sp. M28-CT-15]|uniref:family 3 encapsulin nanocompartment shell protein n=1 Tax=Krasilnikovia sp. M28-CT-15 TaxID=3373540 RepID=UPI003876CBB2